MKARDASASKKVEIDRILCKVTPQAWIHSCMAVDAGKRRQDVNEDLDLEIFSGITMMMILLMAMAWLLMLENASRMAMRMKILS